MALSPVQEIGGWASLRMLERYAHPTGDEMAKAVRVLAEHTGTKSGTAANRAVKNEEPDVRKRVVEDWSGVPNRSHQGCKMAGYFLRPDSPQRQ